MEKPFFPSLLEYMMSGPVTCMVWEGTNPSPEPNPNPKPNPNPNPNPKPKPKPELNPKPKPNPNQVWEGTNAVKVGRMMLGETNPQVR